MLLLLRGLLVVGIAAPGCTLLFSETAAPLPSALARDAELPATGADTALAPKDETGTQPAPDSGMPDAGVQWGSRPGMAFVTSANVSGNFPSARVIGGGLAAANAVCNQAAKAGYYTKNRSFKAYLAINDTQSTGQTGAAAQLCSAGISGNQKGWENAKAIEISRAPAFWSNTFEQLGLAALSTLLLTENGLALPNESDANTTAFPGPKVWVGSLTGTSTSNNDCNGWRSGTSDMGMVITTSFNTNANDQNCALLAHLLCVEVPELPK